MPPRKGKKKGPGRRRGPPQQQQEKQEKQEGSSGAGAGAGRVSEEEAKISFNSGVEAERAGRFAEAAQAYRKAADVGGLKEAQHNLGGLYARGEGVAQNAAAAVRWYREAVEQGYAPSQFSLGFMHQTGQGVAQDLKKAAQLYQLAVDAAGLPEAQYNLGGMYRDGKGVPQDDVEAVRLFKLAVAQESDALSQAQTDLAGMYFRGRGVPQDLTEGMRLLQLSADQGNSLALANLAQCYEHGMGVEKNLARAKQYYRQARKEEVVPLANGAGSDEVVKQQLDMIKHTCATCKKVGDGLKVCARCQGPRYCSTACQKADWTQHKLVCEKKVN